MEDGRRTHRRRSISAPFGSRALPHAWARADDSQGVAALDRRGEAAAELKE
jgi:hypothetical protein